LEARKLKTVEEILDDALANQFLLTLQPDIKAWVESRQPKSSIECATLADLWFETLTPIRYQNMGPFK